MKWLHRALPLAGTSALVILIAGTLASLPYRVHPYFDATVDASTYIVTARNLLAGEGYTYLGEPFILRPPGFSFLLLPVLALAGTDFFVLNFCVSLCGALAVVLLAAVLFIGAGITAARCGRRPTWPQPANRDRCGGPRSTARPPASRRVH